MSSVREVSLQMEKVRQAFEYADNLVEKGMAFQAIQDQIELVESEFRCIAYEALSMGIANHDFSQGHPLTSWLAFMKQQLPGNMVQVHAGLGWAIAQKDQPIVPLLKLIEPAMCNKVIDGSGYYHGMFRSKQSIKQQFIPEVYREEMLTAFDNGVGRSMWYLCHGDTDKVAKMIHNFPAGRQFAFWRGVGLAASFVGGCSEDALLELLEMAGQHKKQLLAGLTLTVKSRVMSNTITNDLELACKIWCNLSVDELMTWVNNSLTNNVILASDEFEHWVSTIEMEKIHLQLTTDHNV